VNEWFTCYDWQVMHLLRVLSETTSRSITEIMQPHKDVLNEMIPPKKHLLRYQPANAQIGLMVWCSLLFHFTKCEVDTKEQTLFFPIVFALFVSTFVTSGTDLISLLILLLLFFLIDLFEKQPNIRAVRRVARAHC